MIADLYTIRRHVDGYDRKKWTALGRPKISNGHVQADVIDGTNADGSPRTRWMSWPSRLVSVEQCEPAASTLRRVA